MRFQRFLVIFVVLALVTLGLASCGGGEGEGKGVIKVGLTAPLSGVGAKYGQDCQDGISLAIEDINAKGGITVGGKQYIFELYPADDEAVPDKAKANAERFVLESGIKFVFCPYATCINTLMDMNTRAGEEFLIMAYTSVPLYTQRTNPYMVTLPPPFSSYIPDFIKFAMGKGWKKVALLQTTGSYGELWGKYFKEAWSKAGGTVVAEAPASYYTETDFTAYIQKAMAGGPDVLFVGGPSQPTAQVMKQARGLGFKGGFIVIDQAKMDEIADVIGMDMMEGAVGVLPVEDSQFPATLPFAKKYKDRFGRRCTWETVIHYSAFHILARAIEKAGTVEDVKAIRDAFNAEGVAILPGEEYPMQFSGINPATGALFMPATASYVEGGKFVPLEMIEWWKK